MTLPEIFLELFLFQFQRLQRQFYSTRNVMFSAFVILDSTPSQPQKLRETLLCVAQHFSAVFQVLRCHLSDPQFSFFSIQCGSDASTTSLMAQQYRLYSPGT